MKAHAAFLLVAAVLLLPCGLQAQVKPPKDQELLAQYAKSHPCPATIPATWHLPDSAGARSPLCPLLVATAEQLALSTDSLIRWTVAHAICARVLSFEGEDMTDHTKSAAWLVYFVADSSHLAGGSFNRQTGEVKYHLGPPSTGAHVRSLCGRGA